MTRSDARCQSGRRALTSVYHCACTVAPRAGFAVMCLYAIAWTPLDRRNI